MCAKEKSETPLMKQYYSIKGQYPGALLLFRVGDFYETFEEDTLQVFPTIAWMYTFQNL